MTAQQMVFEAACPHCTKEQHILVLADEDRGGAVLVAGKDKDHLTEMLREQLAEVDGLDDFGVRRGGRRG